jgi:hypothetical protein
MSKIKGVARRFYGAQKQNDTLASLHENCQATCRRLQAPAIPGTLPSFPLHGLGTALARTLPSAFINAKCHCDKLRIKISVN